MEYSVSIEKKIRQEIIEEIATVLGCIASSLFFLHSIVMTLFYLGISFNSLPDIIIGVLKIISNSFV